MQHATLEKLQIPKAGWYGVALAIDGVEFARTMIRYALMKQSSVARAAGLA